jgi:hypothetical protein
MLYKAVLAAGNDRDIVVGLQLPPVTVAIIAHVLHHVAPHHIGGERVRHGDIAR